MDIFSHAGRSRAAYQVDVICLARIINAFRRLTGDELPFLNHAREA
jgi:hypothetical protein